MPLPSRASLKRKSIDTPTDSTSEKRRRSGAEDGTCRYREPLIGQLTVAPTSTLPIVSNDGRCALVAVLVALGKMDNGGAVANSVVVEQSRQELARCLEQWTERMWVKHVPACLRRRHWSGSESKHKQSSYHAYLDLLLLKQQRWWWWWWRRLSGPVRAVPGQRRVRGRRLRRHRPSSHKQQQQQRRRHVLRGAHPHTAQLLSLHRAVAHPSGRKLRRGAGIGPPR